jgi:hypothetical protein
MELGVNEVQHEVDITPGGAFSLSWGQGYAGDNVRINMANLVAVVLTH